MNSIPYTAPHPGLLYAPGLDLATWALYAIVGLVAIFLMPGQLRESVGRLWAPLGAFLAGLCWPLAVAGCWAWVRLSGAVLVPIRPEQWGDWPDPDGDVPDEQPRRLAYMGFLPPILT